jgi:hypothetical protein
MTKPVTLPRWATDETNNTAPSSGQQDTGWTPGQDGTSDYDNWAKNWTYKWLKWIDDGFTGDVTFAGSTTFTGTVSHALTASTSSVNIAGAHALYVTPDVDGWTLSGLVGGTDGRELDIINVSATKYFLIHHTDPVVAGCFALPITYIQEHTKLMVPPGGSVKVRYVGAATNWRVISTTGCMKYERVRIPASAATPVIDNTSSLGAVFSGAYYTGDVDPLDVPIHYYPITLPTYSLIDNWRFYMNKDAGTTGASGSINRTLGTSGASAAVGTGGSSSGSGYISFVDATANINHRVSGAYQYYFVVSNGDNGTDEYLHLDVFAWIPF